jgi:hypothetical protein
MRGKTEKGKCPMCGEEDDPVHITLKCSENKFWSEVYIKNEWGHLLTALLMMKIANIRNK